MKLFIKSSQAKCNIPYSGDVYNNPINLQNVISIKLHEHSNGYDGKYPSIVFRFQNDSIRWSYSKEETRNKDWEMLLNIEL